MAKLAPNKRVKFNPEDHTYRIGRKQLIGVTSLMRKHGLSADYSGIDPDTLARAAALGTAAHRCIEDYCDGLPVVENKLLKSFKKLGLSIAATELLISDNETVASSIDLVAETGEKDTYDLIDIKRTDKVHTEALAWQLGIYKYLVEKQCKVKVRDCYCLHVKKGDSEGIENDTCKPLIKIEPAPAEEVEELIRCEREGERYMPMPEDGPEISLVLNESEIAEYQSTLDEISAYKAAMAVLEQRQKELQEKVLAYMLENNVPELKSDTGSFKVKAAYQRTSIDSAKLKKDHPELAEQYTKTATVAASLIYTAR